MWPEWEEQGRHLADLPPTGSCWPKSVSVILVRTIGSSRESGMVTRTGLHFKIRIPNAVRRQCVGDRTGRSDWVERTSDWRLCRNCGKSRMETIVAWVKQISRRRVELLWPRVLGFLPSALFCSSLDLGMRLPTSQLERLLLHKVSLYHLTCL